MGDVVKGIFKPIGKILGIEEPKLPNTREALQRSEELGVPSEADLESGKQVDEATRKKIEEQKRRRAQSRRSQRSLSGTGGEQQEGGLISGTTGNGGSRLIGL